MPSARKREEKQEAEIKKKKTYPTSPRETEKLFETRKKNLRRDGRNFERKKKKRKKEREEEKINSNESKEKKTRREEKKNRVKEDVVESRGETWVKKREHANGADKEGSAQERQARGPSVSWFPWN